MAGRLLPDSNAFIALMRGDEGLVEIFDAALEFVLSVIVLGELAYGAMNSRSVEANLAKLAGVALTCRLVPIDETEARKIEPQLSTAVSLELRGSRAAEGPRARPLSGALLCADRRFRLP